MAANATHRDDSPCAGINMTPLIDTEAARSPQPEVHITVDRSARYDVVAKALSDLQYRGLRRIGFVSGETH